MGHGATGGAPLVLFEGDDGDGAVAEGGGGEEVEGVEAVQGVRAGDRCWGGEPAPPPLPSGCRIPSPHPSLTWG